MTRRGQKTVGLLWRWHRRTGVVIFVFLLSLTSTGIVLNHAAELHLDSRFVGWSWLTSRYGDSPDELVAFPADGHWISRAVNGLVYFDAQEVASCRGQLVGALQVDEGYLAACTEELLLLTPQGQLIESITTSTGLPAPLVGLGRVDGRVVLQSAERWLQADLEQLDFQQPAPPGALVQQQVAADLPQSIHRAIPAAEQWLTWERVLLDLHSGRLFGSAGVWLMDLVAVLLACIAFSGVTMWWLRRHR